MLKNKNVPKNSDFWQSVAMTRVFYRTDFYGSKLAESGCKHDVTKKIMHAPKSANAYM